MLAGAGVWLGMATLIVDENLMSKPAGSTFTPSLLKVNGPSRTVGTFVTPYMIEQPSITLKDRRAISTQDAHQTTKLRLGHDRGFLNMGLCQKQPAKLDVMVSTHPFIYHPFLTIFWLPCDTLEHAARALAFKPIIVLTSERLVIESQPVVVQAGSEIVSVFAKSHTMTLRCDEWDLEA